MRAACPVLKISMLVRFEVLTAEMMKMWRRVVLRIITNISKEYAASIFRVEELVTMYLDMSHPIRHKKVKLSL
jgi:hypothetical protein